MSASQSVEVRSLDPALRGRAARILESSWCGCRPPELHLSLAQAQEQLCSVAGGRSRWLRVLEDRAMLVVDVKTEPRSAVVRAAVHAQAECPLDVLYDLAADAVAIARSCGATILQLTYPPSCADATCLSELQFEPRSATIESFRALEQSEELKAPSIELQSFSGDYPAAHLEACCSLKSELALTARGDRHVDASAITPTRLRADAAAASAAGTPAWGVLAMSPGHEVIGVCDFILGAPNPACAKHVDTVITRAERGRGFGSELKRRSLSMLKLSAPEVRYVWTHNNELNAAIRALNRSLGYREAVRMPWVEQTFSQGES